MIGKPYTQREELLLIHGYENKLAPRVIAKRLGRTYKSVTTKAHQLRMLGRLQGGAYRGGRPEPSAPPLADFRSANL